MTAPPSHLWLPFTQMRGFDRASRSFVAGSGTSLIDARGRRVYDAVSSIWTIVHGHAHPRIVEAIARQAAVLDHATLLGATHPPAEELAWRLCVLAGMDYAFFSSDGASAVEAAIKMALAYWQRAGQPQRTRFVRLDGAYHGDTASAMSVSGIATFKARYGAIVFETSAMEDGPLGDDVAAVIVEPRVRAAAGMQMVAPQTYERLRGATPLVIVDEIATGFGRTGSMFASEGLPIVPDMLCVGKGLTGGTLALSAVLVRSRVHDAFLGDPGERAQFFHGHSYAGNPIACAAALASLALFEEEGTLARAEAIARRAGERAAALRSHPRVHEVRQCGTMTGIEVRPLEGSAQLGAAPAADALYARGQFTRAIGNTLQFVPPLSSSDRDVDGFFDALESALSP
jgi:adenosylmethionine-8-amino-7-oxononanoate aminotransferase